MERNERQSALPDMELVDIIESMTVGQRIEYKRQLLSEISDREKLCRMVDDANYAEGADVAIIH